MVLSKKKNTQTKTNSANSFHLVKNKMLRFCQKLEKTIFFPKNIEIFLLIFLHHLSHSLDLSTTNSCNLQQKEIS